LGVGLFLARQAATLDSSPWLERRSPLQLRLSRPGLIGSSALLFLIVLTVAAFVAFLFNVVFDSESTAAAFRLTRIVSGGIVSPAPVAFAILGALYVGIFVGLRRVSLVGNGFSGLGSDSPVLWLMVGGHDRTSQRGSREPEDLNHADGAERDLNRFVGKLDAPAHYLPLTLYVAIGTFLAVSGWVLWSVAAVDGRAFSYFLWFGSLAVLGTSLLLLAQAAEIWRVTRSKLVRLGRTRLESAFEAISSSVSWNLSLVPPRLSDLMPIAERVDHLRSQLLHTMDDGRWFWAYPNSSHDRRANRSISTLGSADGRSMRSEDCAQLASTLEHHSYASALNNEVAIQKYAPLLQSRTWMTLWRVSNAMLQLLQAAYWQREASTGATDVSLAAVSQPVGVTSHGHLLQKDDHSTPSHIGEPAPTDSFSTLCHAGEQIVALQCAFLVRDVLARIMSALCAAMVCVTLLAIGHLMYVFEDRSSAVTLDLLAIGVVSITSMWIIIGMERDRVLSRLRASTPDRVDFNWDFVRRMAVYGVLPLVVIVASLFPEVGDSALRWLEPLRKLTSF
jgi:hypothetical protein